LREVAWGLSQDGCALAFPVRPAKVRSPAESGRSKRKDVAKNEAVAGNDFAGPAVDWTPVHRSAPDEGVKLAVLSARVNSVWQVGEEGAIECPAGEGWIHKLGIDTDDDGLEPFRDHVLSQLRGVVAPQRKDAVLAGAGETLFAIGADVLKEEVGERHMIYSAKALASEGGGHPLLVCLVRAGGRNPDLDDWQAEHLCLAVEELLADAGDTDAVIGLSERGQERLDFVSGVTEECPEAEG
jgi:hypothetical protein